MYPRAEELYDCGISQSLTWKWVLDRATECVHVGPDLPQRISSDQRRNRTNGLYEDEDNEKDKPRRGKEQVPVGDNENVKD